MGRPQKQLDPTAGDVQAFAHDLRVLHQDAGKPTYRNLGSTTHYSPGAISRALGGDVLPSLPVTLALVEALGGDTTQWERRWRETDGQLVPGSADTGPDSDDLLTSTSPTTVRRRGRLLLLGTVVAIVITVSLAMAVPRDAGSTRPPQASAQQSHARVRWTFDRPDQRWWIFWGSQVTQTRIMPGFDHGMNAFSVTISGAATPTVYSGVGVDHDVVGLRPGMKVTMRLWTPGPERGAVSFFVKNPKGDIRWMPDHKVLLTEHRGWSTVGWTVPAIPDRVSAIGIQLEEETNDPVQVAIDNISW
jgi:hypothetical protein